MGFIDKLKNIFFEEEEEEVGEVKKEEVVEQEKKVETEVIAKKVEIPKKKEEFDEIAATNTKKTTVKFNNDLIFDDDDFIFDSKPKKEKTNNFVSEVNTKINSKKPKETYNKEPIFDNYKYSKPKEVKEEVKTFKPSPIISPIYGILDKNYKKDEVKENKEIRISQRPVKMDFDSIRNKAFGDLENDLFDGYQSDDAVVKGESNSKKTTSKNVIKKSESTSNQKPTIEKVTLEEADEYFNDLGLAYDTDYKDLSKDISDGKVQKDDKKDNLEDNLFDLIESMYDKED